MPAAGRLPRTRRLRGLRSVVMLLSLLTPLSALVVVRVLLEEGWRDRWPAALVVAAVGFGLAALWVRAGRTLGERARIAEQEERAALGEHPDADLPYGISRAGGYYVVRGRRALAAVFGGIGVFFLLIGLLVFAALEEDRLLALGTIGGPALILIALAMLPATARLRMDAEGIERRYGTIRSATWAQVPTIAFKDRGRRLALSGSGARPITVPLMVMDVRPDELVRFMRQLRGF